MLGNIFKKEIEKRFDVFVIGAELKQRFHVHGNEAHLQLLKKDTGDTIELTLKGVTGTFDLTERLNKYLKEEVKNND